MDVLLNSFIIKWFYSFVTNRTHDVRIGKMLSECRPISTGAPPGCIWVFTYITWAAGRAMLIIRVLTYSKDCIFYADLVLGVNQKIMFVFYQAVLESIIRYGMNM